MSESDSETFTWRGIERGPNGPTSGERFARIESAAALRRKLEARQRTGDAPAVEMSPVQAKAAPRRQKRRSRLSMPPRPETIPVKRITRAVLAAGAAENPPTDDERPKTRGECRGGARPCPWVACRHHLYLEVNTETGSIKLNLPSLEPWELAESCSLDVAERGVTILEDVGLILNVTRERARQLEVKALHAMKAAGVDSGVLDSDSPAGFAHPEYDL